MNSYDMFQPVAIACSRLGPGPNRTVLFGFIGSLRIGAGVGLLGSRVYDYMMWPRMAAQVLGAHHCKTS